MTERAWDRREGGEGKKRETDMTEMKRTTWKTKVGLGGGLLGIWSEQRRRAKEYWTRHLIKTQNTWHTPCQFIHTSLNSGLRVFLITAVLCLDFFFTSGFRYLERERHMEEQSESCRKSRTVGEQEIKTSGAAVAQIRNGLGTHSCQAVCFSAFAVTSHWLP